MKIAIVHDFLNQYGGAERVLKIFHDMFPDAPIFTSIFLPGKFPQEFSTWDIRPSFMQHLPFLDPHFKKYLPLFPLAMERFDLSGYDVILSSSSAFAKGIRVPPHATHICYCYTPMRFVWTSDRYFEKERINPVFKFFLPLALNRLKKWDLATNKNVHRFVAISNYIRDRIKAAYGRDSEVIYPPVEMDRFSISPVVEDFYLIISRLNPYKNIDLAIETFNRINKKLVIIGTGPAEKELKSKAGKNVQFLGRVSDADLPRTLSRCRAFIFPGEEDFGIAPVEAMASGRPVISFGRGGALETVTENISGQFFHDLTVASMKGAMDRLDRMPIDPVRIRAEAERFSVNNFKNQLNGVLHS